MTGRDLIIYILKNGLEDEPVFKDGKFVGFMSTEEAAVKMGTGVATIYALAQQRMIEFVRVNSGIYIPATSKLLSDVYNPQCASNKYGWTSVQSAYKEETNNA